MNQCTRALTFLRLANFIVILGNGITWTGLSYDLVVQFHDPRYMALMQVLAVAASFMGPFISLWLNSRTTVRTIIVANECLATICCWTVFVILQHHLQFNFFMITTLSLLIFLILLTGSISGLFIEPLYANLIEKRDGSDKNVRTEFATFASYGILSKLCGMSIGPYLFALIGQYSLLLNSLSFFLSACILSLAMNHIPKDIGIISIRPESMTIFRISTLKHILRFPLLETAIANSLIFIVVLSMSTQAMTLQATPSQLSFFWFGATGCAFISHFFLSRWKSLAETLFQIERKFGFYQVAPVFVGLMTNNVVLLLASQWLFSLLNPLATNQSRADFYRTYGRDNEVVLDAYAMRTFITNLIVFSFSVVVAISGTKNSNIFFFIAIAGFILLRWGLARNIQANSTYAKI